ncbi:TauD/TfdA dioxygenase family protein [Streptomyces sp. NPDC054796]
MESQSLHENFAKEVTDIDLRALDEETLHEIRVELGRHGVLVFRDQLLEDADLVRLSARLGDGRLEEPARTWSHAPTSSFLSYLTNLQDATGRALGVSDNHTDFWHSDQEFRCAPATLASLYCLVPPQKGGATSFATTALSRLGLPEELVRRIRPLWSTRRPAPTHDNVDHVEVSHPVVLTAPRDGAEFAYVSENTERFIGLSAEEGREIKEAVLARVLHPSNVYSHEWRMGDFVVYDNAQVLHRRELFEGNRWIKGTKIFAPADYFAVPAGEVVDAPADAQGAPAPV